VRNRRRHRGAYFDFMDPNTLLLELGKLAEKLDIELRFDQIDTPGGLCTLKGKKILLVNKDLDAAEQVEVIVGELARQDGVEDIYLLPGVRRLIEERR